MRAVTVKFSSPEADQSLRPPLPSSAVQAGAALVNACDAACSIDHRISGAPRPIVEFLYIGIIEARSGCA
jgi:hypothetical protein